MTIEEKLRSTGNTWCSIKKEGNLVSKKHEEILNYDGYQTLSRLDKMESELTENIMRLKWMGNVQKYSVFYIDKLIDKFEIEKNNGLKLHSKQRDAVIMVVNNNISILTGGPGTGKTTVLKAIAYVLRCINKKCIISYTAPTGKAANRIKESTGENAITLHKKLGITMEKKTATKMVIEDVLFIDESSMLDLYTANELFKSINIRTKVVLVGDPEQLPSVGIGSVLQDCIDSKEIPTTMLTKTFRQDNNAKLFCNIKKIKEGKFDLEEGSDFELNKVTTADKNEIAKILRDRYIEEVKKYGVDNVCLLLPYRKSKRTISTSVMNSYIQGKLNKQPMGFVTQRNGRKLIFYKGDIVMQTVNRPECANGDVGYVKSINKNGIIVNICDTDIMYDYTAIEQLDLAYSITIHKSQGSEYKSVIMCLLDDYKAMLNRNLVYTGVTRAKNECILFYQEEALKESIKGTTKRKSMLSEKLKMLDTRYLISSID